MGRWEVRQELPRSTSFWLIFLTFGGQEEVFGKNFCSILLLLTPSFVEGSKTEIGVQGVPKKWPAKRKYSPKLIAVGPKFSMGMTWGRLIQLLTK